MRKLLSAILFCVSYVAGIVLATVYAIGEFLLIVEMQHKERYPRWEHNMIIAVNHPRLVEAVFAPALLIREWFLAPRKWGPWSAPDQTNTKKKWWWFFWLGLGRSVQVPRGDLKGMRKAFLRVLAILRSGGRVIIFPEGGRTWKGKDHLMSRNGHKIRPLKNGVGKLVARTEASVLPVWVDYAPVRHYFRRSIVIIKIGEPMYFPRGVSHQEVTVALEKALLDLADEGED